MSHSIPASLRVTPQLTRRQFSEQLVAAFEWLTSVYGAHHPLHRIAAETWGGRSRPSYVEKLALLRAIRRWEGYDFYRDLRKEVKRL